MGDIYFIAVATFKVYIIIYRKIQKVKKKRWKNNLLWKCLTLRVKTISLAWTWISLTTIAYILWKQRLNLYNSLYYTHFFMLFFLFILTLINPNTMFHNHIQDNPIFTSKFLKKFLKCFDAWIKIHHQCLNHWQLV